MRSAEELLYDSEASFRLVDHAIRELSASGAEPEGEATGVLADVELDAEAAMSEADRHRMVASLREELGGVVNQLQFHDITAQQLKHIEMQLSDMNRRITQVLRIFAPPSGTMRFAENGQAVADQRFAIRAGRKSA
jgi:hypothetical protein